MENIEMDELRDLAASQELDESISDISELGLLGDKYNETEESRAMREAMEDMVSSVVPTEADPTEDDIVVLAPDHPMLQGFHKSVAKHLEKQRIQILNDTRELAAQVKAKRTEVDDFAETLFILQQTVRRQQVQLDHRADNLANDTEVRQDLDGRVQELREQHKLEAATVVKAQTNEERLWHKLNEHTQKEHEARVKKEEEDSKLAVVRRTTEKAHVDKKILAEEKRKQDEFVYRLTCEVAEQQSRLSQLDSQYQAKQQEHNRLAQATSSSADDLVAQNEEYLRLVQAWQRLLISAQSRDQAHAKLLAIKEGIEEEKRVLEVQIEGYHRGGVQEMERNEKLTLCIRHLERGQQATEKQLRKEQKCVQEEETKLDNVDTMLNDAEEELGKIRQKCREQDERKAALEKDISIFNREQLKLEQQIFEAINEQASQDKAVYHAIKIVEKLNKEIDEWETQLAQKVVAVNELGLEIQKQRFQEACTKQLLDQHQATVQQAEGEVDHVELQLYRTQAELVSEQSILDRLNRRLNALLAKTGGKEISPTEILVKELEDKVKNLTTEVERLQKKLLRKEIGLLEQTKTRTSLKQEIEECQKHLAHLQHKSVTQKESLEKIQQQDAVLKRKTEEELHILSVIDKEHSKLRDVKQSLEQENMFAYKDIIAARKEEEKEVVQLGKSLTLLAEEREQLHKSLADLQKSQVDLEAKVTLASETKQAIEKERGSSGEIAALKSEIHRMEVRLGQLKRTQERLTLDLEQCVLRRDAMVDTARARNTRSSGPSTAQMKILRKLENLRHSNKQLLLRIQQLHIDKAAFTKLEEEIKSLEEALSAKQKDMLQIKEPYLASHTRLESLLIRKKQNLEQLVHEQRRCRGLSDAKEGRYKPLSRSEVALMSEAQRQRVTRANLLSVIDSLHPDFPLLGSQLSAIAAQLKSIRVVYTTEPAATQDDNSQAELQKEAVS